MSVFSRSVFLSLVCSVFVTTGCGKKEVTEVDISSPACCSVIDSVIVPGADVILFGDESSAASTVIGKAIKEVSVDFEKQMRAASIEQDVVCEKIESTMSELGVTDDDLVKAVFSVDIPDELFINGFGDMEGDDFNILLGIELKKAVDPDKIAELLKPFFLSVDEGIVITKQEYKGSVLLVGSDSTVTKDNMITSLSLAFLKDGRVLVAGPTKAVKAAVDRSNLACKCDVLTEEMKAVKATVAEGAQGYFVLSIPPAALIKIKAMKSEVEESKTEEVSFLPPLPPVDMALGCSVSTVYGDSLHYEAAVLMENDEVPAVMENFLRNTVISAIRLGCSGVLGATSLDALNNLAASCDGRVVKISTDVSKTDLITILDLVKKYSESIPVDELPPVVLPDDDKETL